jgi:hypothetical protein
MPTDIPNQIRAKTCRNDVPEGINSSKSNEIRIFRHQRASSLLLQIGNIPKHNMQLTKHYLINHSASAKITQTENHVLLRWRTVASQLLESKAGFQYTKTAMEWD